MRLPNPFQPRQSSSPAASPPGQAPPWDSWEGLPASIYAKDADGRFVFVNDRLCRILGQPAAQLTGKRNSDLFDDSGAARLTGIEDALLAGRIESFFQTFPLRFLDGEHIELSALISGSRVTLPGGLPGMVGVAIDVTAFADTELHLARERDFSRTVLDTADTLIAVIDLNYCLVRWNHACERLVGCHESELKGKPITDLLADEGDLAPLRENWIALLNGNSPQTGVNRLRGRNGRELWMHWSAAVVRDDDGNPEYVVLTAVNISQQVLAENQQHQLAIEFRAVWETARDAMIFLDAEGRIVAANPSFLALTRTSREEVEGRPFVAVLRAWPGHEEEEIERFKQDFRHHAIEPGATNEYVLRSGQSLWLECANSLIDRPGLGPLLLQVIRNITSRVQAEQELRSTNEFLQTTTQWAREMAAKAEMASAAKTEFLANASHEIRTPMNGVLGMTELALMTELSPEQKEYLGLVKSSAESLLALLDDLLDLSKVEAGHMELAPEPFHLRTLLADTMRPMRLRASARGLDVSWTVDESIPAWLTGDRGRLRQVLLNLTANSIKFTDSGRIHLDVDSLGLCPNGKWRIRFVVRDTGIGIAQDSLDSIFEPFAQVSRSAKPPSDGTGLGLSISNRLVELMGGRIFAASSTGQGSTFSFTIDLPVAAHPGSAAQPQAPPAVSDETRPELRILVAEDHPVNQKLIQGMLRKAGHLCVIAADGRAAVHAAQDGGFDLVLMDVQMPGMDGLEATRRIRAAETSSGCRLPIVAMTAHAMPGDRERCFDAGMDGYLSKPIRLDTLVIEIERAIRARCDDPQPLQSFSSGGEQPKMHPVIDGESALARVGGDIDLLAELAGLFLDEYPLLLAKAREGVESGDLATAAGCAHQLKGLLAQFGCEAGRQAALRLETALKQSPPDGSAETAADELARLLAAARPELVALSQARGPSI